MKWIFWFGAIPRPLVTILIETAGLFSVLVMGTKRFRKTIATLIDGGLLSADRGRPARLLQHIDDTEPLHQARWGSPAGCRPDGPSGGHKR